MKKAAKQPSPPNSAPPIRAPSPLLLALEGRAFIEWAACIAAWPLLACAARGDGHPVMVLPGLAVGDTTTLPLRKFIEGRGYATYGWDLGLNYGPRDGIMRKLVARLHQIEREHRRTVSLVGWSLGGAMARALAVHEPKRVRSVISLGSPLNGEGRATNAWRIFEFVSGVRSDDPRLRKLMSRNPSVPSTSILSKTDGIVAWPASLIPQTKLSENIEVGASHFGMGANPSVLWAIADRLAQVEGAWKPFDRSGLRTFLYDDPRAGDSLLAT